MKKTMTIVAALALIFLFIAAPISAYNASPLKILVNGKAVTTEAKLINGKVYAPVSSIGQALGGKVTYDAKTQTTNIATTPAAAPSKSNDELIPEVIAKVSPSVVGIIGNWKVSDDYSDNPNTKYLEEIIHGTGVIIKPNGQILTNAHVVKDMNRIIVVLADGTGYEAKLKSIDEATDLALIQIQKNALPAAQFGSEQDIIIGKTVIAIGTPISFSLRNSASTGIISGVNRSIDSSYRLIQTDAAINPGNSGGPLIDLKGQIIGINSAKFSGTGIEGMGFSIPLNTIQYVLSHFEKYGKVKRPYLGADFEEDWAAKVGLPSASGLKISRIESGSPAEKMGIKADDMLMAVNDKKINSIVDYNEEMKKYLPKDTVTVKIKRDGVIQSMKVVMGEQN